jgi:hypothetical protein
MAQIVHDLAPGAAIRFASAFNGEQDFADQIRGLAANGASVIVDDITYFAEPMYQDGVIGKAVEDVHAQGVTYFSSAGNENKILGGQDVASYEAQSYRPTTCPAAITAGYGATAGVDCHNFNADAAGAADPLYGFGNNGSVRYLMGWDEPQFGIGTDLDLCILNSAGTAILFCSSTDNLATQKAFESFQGTASGTFSMAVVRFSGAATPRFKLVSWRSALTSVEYATSSGGDVVGPTIFGHNASRSGATVAAIPYDNADTLETFSSRGPATYCWGPVDGTTPAAPLSPCETATVDMSATDGTANSFFGGYVNGTYRFYGTSAAAPHAAAVAALVREVQPCLSPSRVMDVLTSTAVPIGSFGADAMGAGRLDADAALSAAEDASCDVDPPAVTVSFPSAPASGWFTTTQVTGSVTATDDLSGVASIECTGADLGPVSGLGTLTASATLTASGDGIHVVSCTATDGESRTDTDGSTVQVDATAPTLSPVVSPDPVVLGGSATASANAVDATSGVASQSCGPVVTTAVGSFTVTCTAADVAGNTATATAGYTVGAFFGTFIAPLPVDGPQKASSSLPVKFTLRDVDGPLSVSASKALASAKRVRAVLSGPGTNGPVLVASTCSWNTDGFFQCNIKTPKNLALGVDYIIEAQEGGADRVFFTVPGEGNPETVVFK